MLATKLFVLLGVAIAASGFDLTTNDVVFHLYTINNPAISEPLLASVNSILVSQYFDLSKRTVITIHGDNDSVGGNFNAFVIPAHLSAEDVNVVAVDWSVGSTHYSYGLANSAQTGLIIADFINILTSSFGYSSDNIKIVGHGLGGHIAGIAARAANGFIPHIVAIDPALVGWTHHPEILTPNDADVVEVLHSTAGIKGYDYPLGDLDFYPNGGTYQPGCLTDSVCSHALSYVYYAESMTREVNGGAEFLGTQCDSYEEATTGSCSGISDVSFGGTVDKFGYSGIYYFGTNSLPPYAQG